jgi:hypothetical protein
VRALPDTVAQRAAPKVVPSPFEASFLNYPSPRPFNLWVRGKMEYRGVHYTVVQGIEPDLWIWRVSFDETTVKSGEAKTRASAITSAVWAIDRALARKKVKPKPPDTKP